MAEPVRTQRVLNCPRCRTSQGTTSWTPLVACVSGTLSFHFCLQPGQAELDAIQGGTAPAPEAAGAADLPNPLGTAAAVVTLPAVLAPAAQETAHAPVAEVKAEAPKKKHHLLRHELTAETLAAAVAYFKAATPEEAAHTVWQLKWVPLQCCS
jgi:hypothetical protein